MIRILDRRQTAGLAVYCL